jgi:CubicO group peptidase (beta-lactamase class C family)
MRILLIAYITLLLAAIFVVSEGALAQTGSPDRRSSNRITSALQPFVDSHCLAGAVTVVADKNQVLDVEAVGFADVAAGRPMETNSIFWIASMSKPITATALMMLVDDGKVKLDDPVARYLPEFAGVRFMVVDKENKHVNLQSPSHRITVRNLLSHTAGLQATSAIESPTLDVFPLTTRVQSYVLMPLKFEPGTSYSYSNAGINTVGRIIEVVSGMPFAEFLKTRLFNPLGMKDTTFWPSKNQVARLAKSYRPNDDGTGLEETRITQLHYPLDDPKREPIPAGGLFSSAADLVRFCQMILNEGVFHGKRIVSANAVRQMTSKQTGSAISAEYGFGWDTSGGVFGHGGAYATNMTIDAKSGLIMIYLVQHAGFPRNGSISKETFQKEAREEFGAISHRSPPQL